jgi:ribosome-binding protein aMBF1 (putative translation factor)
MLCDMKTSKIREYTRNGVAYVRFSDMKRAALEDPEFRKAYEATKPKYDLIRAVLNARHKRGMTQAEIARRAGTTQSAIARFESGRANPTLEFAARVSRAVGARLTIRLAP